MCERRTLQHDARRIEGFERVRALTAEHEIAERIPFDDWNAPLGRESHDQLFSLVIDAIADGVVTRGGHQDRFDRVPVSRRRQQIDVDATFRHVRNLDGIELQRLERAQDLEAPRALHRDDVAGTRDGANAEIERFGHTGRDDDVVRRAGRPLSKDESRNLSSKSQAAAAVFVPNSVIGKSREPHPKRPIETVSRQEIGTDDGRTQVDDSAPARRKSGETFERANTHRNRIAGWGRGGFRRRTNDRRTADVKTRFRTSPDVTLTLEPRVTPDGRRDADAMRVAKLPDRRQSIADPKYARAQLLLEVPREFQIFRAARRYRRDVGRGAHSARLYRTMPHRLGTDDSLLDETDPIVNVAEIAQQEGVPRARYDRCVFSPQWSHPKIGFMNTIGTPSTASSGIAPEVHKRAVQEVHEVIRPYIRRTPTAPA